MNVFFLILLVLFIIFVFLYIYSDEISKKIPYKDSVIFEKEENDCILVPIYMTKFVIGGRSGINISVDGVRTANIKPGDALLVPIRPGRRCISAYCYETEKCDIDVCVDDETMLFAYAEYNGVSAKPFIKTLKKNDHIDESKIEKEYKKMFSDVKSLKISSLIRVFIIVIPLLVAGIFLF